MVQENEELCAAKKATCLYVLIAISSGWIRFEQKYEDLLKLSSLL